MQGAMTRDPNQPYHHGQLSRAALDQALETVRRDGAQALSIRRLAETLGVAHRAIYNHYADRAALLQSVAARGFSELAEQLGKADGKKGFIAAYCHFALANPGLYDLMMATPNEAFRASPELLRAVDLLLRTAAPFWSEGETDSAAIRQKVTRSWMLLHGGVALHRSGILGTENENAIIAQLTRITV